MLPPRSQGQASDIVIHAQEIEKLRSRLNQLYLSHCAQPLDVIGAVSLPAPAKSACKQ